MAGNIIPAIATTNAIVAGMIVTEALKVVFGTRDKLRNIFIKPKPNPRGKILIEEVPSKPNQHCYVCSERREITLKLNVKLTTVHSLENKLELRIRIEHSNELKSDEFVIAMDTDAVAINGQEDGKQGHKIKRPLSDAIDECSPTKIRKMMAK
ncbi:SUMO-activating enzyme subunit 2 [Dirofilaria immitis]|nr:SUMO-activating enzyme subunit 2 [Dirofilaria immitis]